jgi:hypothetical protein
VELDNDSALPEASGCLHVSTRKVGGFIGVRDAEITAGPAEGVEHRLARRQEAVAIRPPVIVGTTIAGEGVLCPRDCASLAPLLPFPEIKSETECISLFC